MNNIKLTADEIISTTIMFLFIASITVSLYWSLISVSLNMYHFSVTFTLLLTLRQLTQSHMIAKNQINFFGSILLPFVYSWKGCCCIQHNFLSNSGKVHLCAITFISNKYTHRNMHRIAWRVIYAKVCACKVMSSSPSIVRGLWCM